MAEEHSPLQGVLDIEASFLLDTQEIKMSMMEILVLQKISSNLVENPIGAFHQTHGPQLSWVAWMREMMVVPCPKLELLVAEPPE